MSGDLKEIHVPGLEKIKVQSFIIYDKRRPLSRIAEDFRQLLLDNRKRMAPERRKNGTHGNQIRVEISEKLALKIPE